ncbi:hypothetical protein C4573_01750 [Candidatus Woesearchaeota archaeon]|nr:MAG: hypothetical protein C4573_01750 [Candidatus Woesearchaeota archaeon]
MAIDLYIGREPQQYLLWNPNMAAIPCKSFEDLMVRMMEYMGRQPTETYKLIPQNADLTANQQKALDDTIAMHNDLVTVRATLTRVRIQIADVIASVETSEQRLR